MSHIQEDYLKKSRDIFKLINDYRKNPKVLSKHLENLTRYLDKVSNVLSEPGKIQIQMVEGDAVFAEAIEYLNSLPALNPLQWDENLALSAMEHVLDIGPKGLLSYQSSDGTEPEERISKYGNYVESLGENIDFGPNDAMGVIVSLTLDDGECDRPHRDNLFKSDYRKIGIACGPHKTEYHMCVMDFAFDFAPLNEDSHGDFNMQKTPAPVNTAPTKNEKIMFDDNKMTNTNAMATQTKKQQPAEGYKYNETFGRNDNNFIQNTNQKNFSNAGSSKPFSENTFPQGNSKVVGTSNMNYPMEGNVSNQSPLVRLSIDNDVKSARFDENKVNSQEFDELGAQMKVMNLKKKVVSKYVEVQTRIVFTFEDGSTKEIIEKQNHTFDLR